MSILDNLLFNLQTIAKIPKGNRISTAKEFIVIEDGSMMQGVWRRLNAESRDKAVASICREVRTTIVLAQYMMESYYLFNDVENSFREKRVTDLKKIRVGLSGALQGIDNLRQTYSSDADVSGHLNPLIDEINECVNNIIRLLSKLSVSLF